MVRNVNAPPIARWEKEQILVECLYRKTAYFVSEASTAENDFRALNRLLLLQSSGWK